MQHAREIDLKHRFSMRAIGSPVLSTISHDICSLRVPGARAGGDGRIPVWIGN